MSDEFPQFEAQTPLSSTRSWTARFDSYNERTEDCYYVITIHEGSEPVARFMVVVPADLPTLLSSLQELAAGGLSNTPYRGSLAYWLESGGHRPDEL